MGKRQHICGVGQQQSARETGKETGKEQVVQIHYDRGTVIRIGLEPCASMRECAGEASAGLFDKLPLLNPQQG